MRTAALGRTDTQVTRLCLGTMTFGEQNTVEEAFAQLDCAVAHGVNFLDTAELYPFPPRAPTAGRTEAIIGEWLASRRGRDRLVIATKIAGPGIDHLRRDDRTRRAFTARAIREAVEASLRRLRTDWIDLYQLHWPERRTNFFGELGYRHFDEASAFTPFEEVLGALAEQITAGKIRAIGVSNETPWGVMRFVATAEIAGLPRIATLQNPYSLLNRTLDVGLAEVAIREQVSLLAYSPLGFGTLTGKYLDGEPPAAARLRLFPEYRRYSGRRAVAATAAYVALARRHGIDPARMAIAFVLSQPFVTAAIIGASSVTQLESDLLAADLVLDPAVIEAIEAIHLDNPNPAP